MIVKPDQTLEEILVHLEPQRFFKNVFECQHCGGIARRAERGWDLRNGCPNPCANVCIDQLRQAQGCQKCGPEGPPCVTEKRW